MVVRRIQKGPTDEFFRHEVCELIDSAKKEILMIAGEIGSYKFPDVRWAFERARKKGVSVKIYASKPEQYLVNSLLDSGIQVYQGPIERHHYLVVDRKSYVHSKPHPPVIGKREGDVYINEPRATKTIVNHFNELMRKAKRIKTVDWHKDPLWKALQKPYDWHVSTPASRLDEEFAS